MACMLDKMMKELLLFVKNGDKIIGVSTHTIEEARWAIENGADYLELALFSQRVRKKIRKQFKERKV